MSANQPSTPPEPATGPSGSDYDDPATGETASTGSGTPRSPDVIGARPPTSAFPQQPGLPESAFPQDEPQPYAFLKQRPLIPPPEGAPFGNVVATLRAFDAQGNSVPGSTIADEWEPDWTWEVTTSDNEIREACMGRWFTQAACHDGLTAFRVTNAEGQQFNQQLSDGQQVLSGHFMMQGFRVETIKDIAIEWASTAPGPAPLNPTGALPIFADFNLVGGQPPASALDRLHLFVTCNDLDAPISEFYFPTINLRVFSGQH